MSEPPAPRTGQALLHAGYGLVQALVYAAWPRRGVLLAGVTVDGLHAAGMVALAVASARWRRAAGTEASLAVTFTAVGARAVRGGAASRRPPKAR